MPDRVGSCRAVSAPCRTVPCQAGPCHRVGLTLAHPWFKLRLQWLHDDAESARATGRSLLWHAALADDAETVKWLLQHEGTAGINEHCRNPDLAQGENMVNLAVFGFTCSPHK